MSQQDRRPQRDGRHDGKLSGGLLQPPPVHQVAGRKVENSFGDLKTNFRKLNLIKKVLIEHQLFLLVENVPKIKVCKMGGGGDGKGFEHKNI